MSNKEEVFKECLYSKDKDIRTVATIGVAIAIYKRQRGVIPLCYREVNQLASMYLVDTSVLRHELDKHHEFINNLHKSPKEYYSVEEVFGYGRVYSEETMRLMKEHFAAFSSGYSFIITRDKE